MSEGKRLLRNTGLIALGNMGVKVFSFLLLPLYTSLLSTSEFGTYDFIVAVSAFLLPVITLSMHEALFRFIIESGVNNKKFKQIVSNASIIVLVGIISLGIILSAVLLFSKSILCVYIWLYVSANCLYTFANYLLRGMGKMKEYAIITSSKNILQLVLNVIVIAVLRWGMEGLLLSMCVSEVLAFVVVSHYSMLFSNISRKQVSGAFIKQMLEYSMPLIPNALCAQIINISDRIIITGMLGKSANGIYSISYKFPNIIETVYHYFYTAWSESASRAIDSGKEEAQKYYQSLHDVISDFVFAVVLLMVSGMPILYRIFVRGDYKSGFAYVSILMFAMYFDSMAKFYSGIFTALKQTKIMAVSTVIAAIINIVINVAFIRTIGLYAAAGSTLIAEIVLVLVRKKYVNQHIEIKSGSVITLSFKVIIAIIVCVVTDYSSWTRIIAGIVISIIFLLISNRKYIGVIYAKFSNK